MVVIPQLQKSWATCQHTGSYDQINVTLARSCSFIPIWPFAIVLPPIQVMNKLEVIRQINILDTNVLAAYETLSGV
jgi:hypothetical protein